MLAITNFLTIGKVTPKMMNKMMLTRRILEVPDAMNVHDTITCEQIAGI
jgi:hypothetical protein